MSCWLKYQLTPCRRHHFQHHAVAPVDLARYMRSTRLHGVGQVVAGCATATPELPVTAWPAPGGLAPYAGAGGSASVSLLWTWFAADQQKTRTTPTANQFAGLQLGLQQRCRVL